MAGVPPLVGVVQRPRRYPLIPGKAGLSLALLECERAASPWPRHPREIAPGGE